ncbi:hypothetical protein K443DRAFT_642446, partial [Laccaria amethystina LaAM-08-1]
ALPKFSSKLSVRTELAEPNRQFGYVPVLVRAQAVSSSSQFGYEKNFENCF